MHMHYESNPDTVTHPSINRAHRRLTLLIKTNDATTTPRGCNSNSRCLDDADGSTIA